MFEKQEKEVTVTIGKFLDDCESSRRDLDRQMVVHLKIYENTNDDKVSCHSCTQASPGCCNQKTMIAMYEGLLLARHIKDKGLDTPEFRARLRTEGDAMEGSSRARWFHEAHPCIFLEKGRCTVYAIRPVICSTYYVVNPSEMCQPGKREQIRHVDHSPVIDAATRQAFWIHRALKLKESSRRILLGTLPRVLLIALEAWDSDDYAQHIRSQPWPNADNLDTHWAEGDNPFRRVAAADGDRGGSGGAG
jgi:Fe-S-cluster containining protein